jgi:hypothetical protein
VEKAIQVFPWYYFSGEYELMLMFDHCFWVRRHNVLALRYMLLYSQESFHRLSKYFGQTCKDDEVYIGEWWCYV